jgi:hypothetical protein
MVCSIEDVPYLAAGSGILFQRWTVSDSDRSSHFTQRLGPMVVVNMKGLRVTATPTRFPPSPPQSAVTFTARCLTIDPTVLEMLHSEKSIPAWYIQPHTNYYAFFFQASINRT